MVFLSIVLLRVCKGDLGFVHAGKYGLCKCISNVSCRYSNQLYGSIIIDPNMNVTWEELDNEEVMREGAHRSLPKWTASRV